MARALRAMRLFRTFTQLRLIMESVTTILGPLVWSTVTLAVLIVMFGVVLLNGVANYLVEGTDTQTAEELGRFFSSMWRCLFSMFLTITGGISWVSISEVLREVGDLYEWMFLLFIILVQLGVLNIVTSMFVSQAARFVQLDSEVVSQEEKALREKTVSELQFIFDCLDSDGSGVIEFDEFMQWTEIDRARAFFERHLKIDVFKAETTFQLLDIDKTGTIERDEFIIGCLRLKGGTTGFDAETQMRCIRRIRKDVAKIGRELIRLRDSLRSEGITKSSLYSI